MRKRPVLLPLLLVWMIAYPATLLRAQGSFQLAVLKYNGGGDWYGNPTAVPNLVKFCNKEMGMNINPEVPNVEVGSPELFAYPWVHMTGHGNVVFSQQEAENLRTYLTAGGFLHISDNYGMDQFIRPMMQRVFPGSEFVELPFSHGVYHQKYDFAQGLPKIHEHDNKPPQGFGLFWEGRLVCFYDYECDLGDGWEDADVHGDSEANRTRALQMGANLVRFAFSGAEN
ncbi:MAG: DUF4159 domain-containing protein [Flavobacteriales bacterium]|nr:MAG: DUF4159 domain-containing protein [Flavobacteriales bacterium]